MAQNPYFSKLSPEEVLYVMLQCALQQHGHLDIGIYGKLIFSPAALGGWSSKRFM